MVRKVIFVDIDGVLLPFPAPPQTSDNLFPSCTLQPLRRLWKHVTTTNDNATATTSSTVEWVLSSTWRVQPSYIRDIEQALQDFGIPIQFADITDPALHSERQWEIHDWLVVKQNVPNCIWLALDDEELIEGDKNAKHRSLFQGHVICTQSHVGLSEQDVDQAIALWNLQIER